MRRPEIIDLSLDRVRLALEHLGSPHHRLPPVIHIAGTNGKGSTLAYLHGIFEAASYRVHKFTSPHLVRFNERIVLGGRQVNDEEFHNALAQCAAIQHEAALTHFETITCAAFLLFAEHPADILLLETGLGGRLDATNVLDAPAACAISHIDYDHQRFLGETIEEIATEKAGIFRKDVPAVIGHQSPEAMSVLRQQAEAKGAHPYARGMEWDAYGEQDRLVFKDETELAEYPLPRLIGDHQIDNAGLAIATLRMVTRANAFEIHDRDYAAGITNAGWPGRLQRLTQGPLFDAAAQAGAAPDDFEIWIDGGHNPSAGRAVARAMSSLEDRSSRRLVLVCAMQANKDSEGFLAPFAGLAASVMCVQSIKMSSPAQAEDLAAAAAKAGLDAQITKDAKSAVIAALHAHQGEPLRILICGSLYYTGEILADHV